MFGHLKKLLRRLVETPGEDQPAPAPDAGAGSSRRIVIASRLETAPPHNNGGHQNGRGIELPLQPILSGLPLELQPRLDRKSTRLNSSHLGISYAVFCLKKKAQSARAELRPEALLAAHQAQWHRQTD